MLIHCDSLGAMVMPAKGDTTQASFVRRDGPVGFRYYVGTDNAKVAQLVIMAPGPGLEPGYRASKARVLPLDDPGQYVPL